MKTTRLALGLLPCLLGSAIAQTTFPINDIASPQQNCYAFTHATVVVSSQSTLRDATLVIRNGIIESVGPQLQVPPGAIVVNCTGKYIYPSFIDLYSDYGMNSAVRGPGNPRGQVQFVSNTRGPYGWNQALKTENEGSALFEANELRAKELRNAGFGSVLSIPTDGISRGTATFVSLANDRENKVMLKEKAAAVFSFGKGSSTQDYPSSLMGIIALLRQHFLDAQWYRNRPLSEGVNLTLQALLDHQTLPQIFDANDKWADLRADRIGDEAGIQFILKAGGNEYQRLEEIKSTKASFIVPLNFPQPMDVEDPTEARFVLLSDLKHWEMAPSNPGAMEKAGINFCLTAYGMKEVNRFMANLRRAIENGLSESKALEALTQTPAQLLGIQQQVGSLEPGKLANFLIVSAPIFSEKSVLYQNWVQGKSYEIKQEGWQDRRGKYQLQFNGKRYLVYIKGDAAKPQAEIKGKDSVKLNLNIQQSLVQLNINAGEDSSQTAQLVGVMYDKEWSGTGRLLNGRSVNWSMKATSWADSAKGTLIPGQQSGFFIKPPSTRPDSSKMLYPFNGYGFKQQPVQQDYVIRHATVWTSEAAGILPNTDVLIRNGKIAAIGNNLVAKGAVEIDGTGKHLTAGIIDEHSHIAIIGGVNECSFSNTAEVRVGDVLNPEDVNIYRQLSGGVTATHLLHGSCNTIGGQTQLIKLRWGADAAGLKMTPWDPFIKFALGENVKRSSTSGNNRFPDTRMGVDLLLKDAFTRAREYQLLPVGKRKDLQLEALSEILQKKRFITCHSYVQSEILALIKLADHFNFTVNTFTHVLEGYKVARELKAHGAYASTFSDWWAFKEEAKDAIPQNAYLMQQVGVNVAINSDNPEMARRLNQEAAKSLRYSPMTEEEAWKMVTINPAIMLHVADRIGSIKVGKDADLVLWTDSPLSVYAKVITTFVDGIVYYNQAQDLLLRRHMAAEKARLIQRMVQAKKGGEKTTPAVPGFKEMNFCEEDEAADNSLLGRLMERMESAQ